MNKTILIISIFLLSPAIAFAETVFMKDGAIVEGKILQDRSNSVTIKVKSGSKRTISKKKILRIIYSEIYLGKVFIKKRDGNVHTMSDNN